MKDAIHGRELFTLEAIGTRIQGTCHFPYPQASVAQKQLHKAKGHGNSDSQWFVGPQNRQRRHFSLLGRFVREVGLYVHPRRPTGVVRLRG